jgi:hypothetical protein
MTFTQALSLAIKLKWFAPKKILSVRNSLGSQSAGGRSGDLSELKSNASLGTQTQNAGGAVGAAVAVDAAAGGERDAAGDNTAAAVAATATALATAANQSIASKNLRAQVKAQNFAREIRIAEAWWFAPLYTNIVKAGDGYSGNNYRNVDLPTPLINIVVGASRGDRQLVLLIDAIQVACKQINQQVTDSGSCTRGEGIGDAGLKTTIKGAKSAGGREKRQLDILANKMFAKALFYSKCCCVLVSSENTEPLIVPKRLAGCVFLYSCC